MNRTPIRKDERSAAYRQLWRVVDGAVADAMKQHPDYYTNSGTRKARASIVKRVTGAVMGYAEQSAQGRSGSSPAADEDRGAILTSWVRRVQVDARRLAGHAAPGQPPISGGAA